MQGVTFSTTPEEKLCYEHSYSSLAGSSAERIDIRVDFPTRKDLPELSEDDFKTMDVGKTKDACRLTFRSLQRKNCICPYRGHTGNKNKWLYFNLATFSATNDTALNTLVNRVSLIQASESLIQNSLSK